MMIELVYVSRSRLPEETADREIARIVEHSMRHNAEQRITGALLFTGTRFCQLLEGMAFAVRDLMEDIARDPRHGEVTIVHDRDIDARRFSRWAMAYSGRAGFAGRQIQDVLTAAGEAERALAVERVIDRMGDVVW